MRLEVEGLSGSHVCLLLDETQSVLKSLLLLRILHMTNTGAMNTGTMNTGAMNTYEHRYYEHI